MLWHYSKGIHLAAILKCGVLLPATEGVPSGERPILWFSANQWFEPTAPGLADGRTATMQEAHQEMGLIRFGVSPETAPLNWHALKRLSGMRSKVARALEEIAIRQGASLRDWWGTFEAVPCSQWLAVEAFDGEKWIPLLGHFEGETWVAADLPLEASECAALVP